MGLGQLTGPHWTLTAQHAYHVFMPPKGLLEVACPCCQATLKIDPDTGSVISHKIPEKPPAVEDLAAAVAKLKGEAGRRDELFRKSFESEKVHGKVLEKKFDELLRQAKENPDTAPPKRDMDFD